MAKPWEGVHMFAGRLIFKQIMDLMPFSTFRKRKAAMKLHILPDLKGNIPTLIHISDGKLHDVSALDHSPLEVGA